MPRYVLLVPLNYNDKSKVSRRVLNRIYDDLYRLAGGYRLGSLGQGAYRMKSGKKQVDVTQEVWIVVPERDEVQLRELVAEFAKLLGQESMYLERIDSTVEFISPPAEEED
jgi:hypothetical protein